MLLLHIKLVKKFKKIKNHHKSPILLKDIEIALVSNKISSGEKKNYKYFIGYLYNDDNNDLKQTVV